MRKIIAFGASSSATSINASLANYAASLVTNATLESLDLNDYETPLFSVDKEKELGSPVLAQQFYKKLGEADGIIISFAEHNGSYSAAYKNLYDWLSRIDTKVYQGKPVLVLATSPGKGGAANVFSQALKSLPHFGAQVIEGIALPLFNTNFDSVENNIIDHAILASLKLKITQFEAVL